MLSVGRGMLDWTNIRAPRIVEDSLIRVKPAPKQTPRPKAAAAPAAADAAAPQPLGMEEAVFEEDRPWVMPCGICHKSQPVLSE